MTSLLLRLFAVLAVLALATGCGGGGDDASGDASTGPQIPESPVITGDPAGYNAADITFASTMVKHHQQGIELAKLASARSGTISFHFARSGRAGSTRKTRQRGAPSSVLT